MLAINSCYQVCSFSFSLLIRFCNFTSDVLQQLCLVFHLFLQLQVKAINNIRRSNCYFKINSSFIRIASYLAICKSWFAICTSCYYSYLAICKSLVTSNLAICTSCCASCLAICKLLVASYLAICKFNCVSSSL